jgi:subtilisin family serine protease
LYLLVDTWEVNIISLSFGYSSDTLGAYGDIKTAISHASERALIFAAARNNGLNQPRAWPAQEPGVFGVYSTDYNGAWSKFNPQEMFESINLATVGEAVRSCWPENLCDGSMTDLMAVKSGTSYATPIAACLAAFLLMFAQTYMKSEEIRKLKKFNHMRRVITAVFEASWDKDHKRPDYTYLAFILKPKNLFNNGKNEEIKDVIRGALKKKKARG